MTTRCYCIVINTSDLRQSSGNAVIYSWNNPSARSSTTINNSCNTLSFLRDPLLLFFFFFSHFFLPASGQAVVTGVSPFPPSVLAFNFNRAYSSAVQLLVDFSSSVATSRYRAFRMSIRAQEKVPTNLYEYALGGLELTKLTYTRLEDNLIRCRGDRSYQPSANQFPLSPFGTFLLRTRYSEIGLVLTKD